jgi:hypothetical protein
MRVARSGQGAKAPGCHCVVVSGLEPPVAGKDLSGEIVRQPGAVDDLPCLLRPASEITDVVRVARADLDAYIEARRAANPRD